jgi:HlyD family secretion protein
MSAELVEVQAAPAGLPAIPAQAVDALEDDPHTEIRGGLLIALVFFVLFLGWAGLARLDAAAYGSGQVTVSGQRQTVQHRDGGVVGEILVKEGDRVKRGQVLIRLAAAEVQAQERALSSQAIDLLAQRARLRAEQAGQSTIPIPPEFAALTGEDLIEARQAMQLQATQLRARSSLLSTQQSVLGQGTIQVRQQQQGYRRQLESIREQERLISEELEAFRPAAEKGFVSQTRIRAMERAKADLAGQRGRLEAAISESSAAAGESQLKIVETTRSLQEKIADDLRQVEIALGEVMPKALAAKDQLARTEVRAPVSGTVVGMTVFTEGGVIAPGQKLMDIVPQKASLVVEARFSPNDVDDLRVGQEADVRFSGLSSTELPTLHGTLTRLSADAFNDEKSGATYFTGDISVPPDQLDLLSSALGTEFELKPGMPVEILVPMRKRTALQYIFEPLTDAVWKSFREN